MRTCAMTAAILMGVLSIGSSRGRLVEPPAVTIERNVEATMRDGVVLRADVYRPKVDGRYPVLLERTPYDKRGEIDFAPGAAARGFAVIVQDVRGRYMSGGEWYTFKNESNDGYDSVEWAAALPYSNGKVGMWGGSYVGATQLLAAIAQPPHLAGICPVITASNYHDGWTYQGGAFEQWFNQSWTTVLVPDTLNRTTWGANAMTWAWTLPLSTYPNLHDVEMRGLAPYYQDWLAHPNDDDYWKRWSIEANHTKIQVPGMHIGGWYDIFQGGTLRNYMGIKAQGANDAARHGQRLIIGPWWHGPSDGKAGDVDFGESARGNMGELMLRWYDHLLRDVANGLENEKPVKLFVMGTNTWREEADWPLARAKAARYFLHSGGQANTLSGDGVLSVERPDRETPDSYVYDPADPVPTRGGGLCCDSVHQPAAARDQRSVEARTDVLLFTTPAFTSDVEVTGPLSLELFAASSAVDTDFTAKLVDVWPNGYAQNLTDGILRARYRASQEKPELLHPGEVYKLTIDLWSTANVFRAGHRMRLEVSSSNFPRFDRNLNTGEDGQSTRMAKATNIVYHDREHPSALVAPVVPR